MKGVSVLVLGFCLAVVSDAQAQTSPITVTFGPTNVATTSGPVDSLPTNAAPAVNPPGPGTETNQPPVEPAAAAPPSAPAPAPSSTEASGSMPSASPDLDRSAIDSAGRLVAALMTLASIGGFLLYQCGLTRAKNCGHTSTLLLVGVMFGLIGYWMGGFAVETGGVGDAHAALATPLPPADRGALDHELGFMLLGHHWGLMGSSGFFLMTGETLRNGTATLFLGQAALLALAVAAALGAALERGRLLPMAIAAFLIGALIYPLLANWVWGGGWLAELGREFGLGHGFVDLAGAGVVHETAGTLALVFALVLGPRHGRFGREKSTKAIPGHNMPFVVLGAVILLLSWTASNAFAYASPAAAPGSGAEESSAGVAAVNALLAAAGGLLISFIAAGWRKQRPEPALLCRGLLGGVVAVSACCALIDPWAAFVIGLVAGLVVQGAMNFLERRRIDDPTGASAVQGAGGTWGVLAAGLFANGTAGHGLNGVDDGVRGLFFGGAWRQLAAQAIGAAAGFVVVFVLGYACLILIQKILGTRVDLVDEVEGLDWPQTGALGYQGDVEPDSKG